MRYTESRLKSLTDESLLEDIESETVDFADNFDGSQQEPTVLPARIPQLLLNGSSGIAVGMATNIPPHNLGELINGLKAIIKNPNLEDRELFELIKGPDFPTGGQILGREGIRETFKSGRGSITMVIDPRPDLKVSLIPSLPRICPPVGKSGPLISSKSSLSSRLGFLIIALRPLINSPKLWGGILVAIPTAIPEDPFKSS